MDGRTLTLSALSLPWPPKTRLGRVGRLSGLGPPEMGVGMGEGEWAGEATRGFWAWGFRLLPWATGTAGAGAGEPASEPNLMLEGAAEVGGVCLMWTEDLRLWSPLGPPLTMVGMAGTAGVMGAAVLALLLPFTGEAEALLPCCAPTAAGAPLDAIVGEEIFLVALAYELRAVG